MFGIGWLAYVIRVFEACLVGVAAYTALWLSWRARRPDRLWWRSVAVGGDDARYLDLGQDGKGRVETMRSEESMNQNSTADMLFLCDAMGAEYPYRDLDRLPRWYGAARANPEKRAAGMATLRAYQRQIPTDADFARVPAEEPKRDVVPMSIQWAPDSLCACGSGKAFAECHGADVPIEPSQEAQGHRPTAAVPCEHEKVYADHVLTSDPPQHPWICRKCNARGADRSGSLRDEQEYNRLIHVRGDNHGQIALGDIRNGAR